jgi:hypothetical protein
MKSPVAKHKLKYRREPNAPAVAETKKWGRVPDAIRLTGLNKIELYRLINEGLIESYIYKFREDAESGVRMINLQSLNAYLDKRAEQARAEAARAKEAKAKEASK